MVAAEKDIQQYRDAEELLREGVGIIAGGFPCQDISVAGKRAGIQCDESTGQATTRSGLFWEMVRSVRLVRPRYWIMENVAAIYDGYLGLVLREVARSGYDAEWDCLSSGRLGRRHLRQRFYAVAYANSIRSQGQQQRMQENQKQGNKYASLFPPFPFRKATPENDLPKPFIVGSNDGVSNRAHRIKALGNTIDPEIAEIIGHAINLHNTTKGRTP